MRQFQRYPTLPIPGLIRPGGGPLRMNRDSDQAQGLVAWWPLGYDVGDDVGRATGSILANNSSTIVTDPEMGLARSFVSASSQYLEIGSAPVTAEPLTMMAWLNPGSAATLMRALSLGVLSATTRWMIGTVVSGFYTADSRDTGNTSNIATSTTAYSVGRWDHVVGRFESSASRKISVNGILEATDTNTRTVGTPTGFDIGTQYISGSRSSYWNGQIADVRLYNYSVPDSIIWQCYDPATRWDLYWVPRRRVYSFASPAAATGGEVIFRGGILRSKTISGNISGGVA